VEHIFVINAASIVTYFTVICLLFQRFTRLEGSCTFISLQISAYYKFTRLIGCLVYLCRDDCWIFSQKLLNKAQVNYSECFVLEEMDPGQRVKFFYPEFLPTHNAYLVQGRGLQKRGIWSSEITVM
jgi:hypothetical protein